MTYTEEERQTVELLTKPLTLPVPVKQSEVAPKEGKVEYRSGEDTKRSRIN